MSKRKAAKMKKLNTREDVYELLSASTASAALGTAIETGLLWLLAEKPLDGAGVAQALNIPVKRCHYWLQYLQSLGILKETPHGYAPSSQARAVILDSFSMDSWKHLALDERERSAGVHDLALYISEPGSVWAAQGLAKPIDYVEKMRESPDRAREFTRMLYEVHKNLANELASRLDLAGVHRLMDLGGNSGVVSMALLRNPLASPPRSWISRTSALPGMRSPMKIHSRIESPITLQNLTRMRFLEGLTDYRMRCERF